MKSLILSLSVLLLTIPVFAQQRIYVDVSNSSSGDGQSWATAYNDLSVALSGSGEDSENSDLMNPQNAIVLFEENKGQIKDQYHQPRKDILFSGRSQGLTFHLREDGISYQISRVESWTNKESSGRSINGMERRVPEEITIQRVDVSWVNANSNYTIVKGQQTQGYNNYYNVPEGVDPVHFAKSYKSITLENLWDGVNIELYSKDGVLELDWVMDDPRKYKKIAFEVEGAELSTDDEGNLIMSTPLGEIREGQLKVFQEEEIIEAKWKIDGNLVAFNIQDYDENLPMRIDPPVRLWGTYYGGEDWDQGLSVSGDGNGNSYLAGWTLSNDNIASSGAHQQTITGFTDAFLVKFDSDGIRQWGTYYGGSLQTTAYSCSVDESGYVYLTGETNSGNNISTLGAHQEVRGGGSDAFLVKFNSDGIRQWGTYYGGNQNDYGFSCSVDGLGNVFITGYTSSNNNISTSGAHQEVRGGEWDAFLVKFNSDGIRQWGTYYGGNQNEHGFSCSVDGLGNVFLTGYTASNNNISTLGAHQEEKAGNWDAFLVKFNSNGIRQWGTYYGGSNNEAGFSCSIDGLGNVFLVGFTTSFNNISTQGVHQEVKAGGTDAFLAKFNSDGIRQWGTYYGGTGLDEGWSCYVNDFGNVFLAGLTDSHNNITTPDAHLENYPGGEFSSFLVKFDSDIYFLDCPDVAPCCQCPQYFVEDNNIIAWMPCGDEVWWYLDESSPYDYGLDGSQSWNSTPLSPGSYTICIADPDNIDWGFRCCIEVYIGETCGISDIPNAYIEQVDQLLPFVTYSAQSSDNFCSINWNGVLVPGNTLTPTCEYTVSDEIEKVLFLGGFADAFEKIQCLTVSNNWGSSSYCIDDVGILPGDLPKINPHLNGFNLTFSLDPNFGDLSGHTSIEWDYGDFSSSFGQLPSQVNHTYDEPGTYLPSVTITFDNDFEICITWTIIIEDPCILNPPSVFAWNEGPYCVGETINLLASGGDFYSWSGPNGFMSSSPSPAIPNATIPMAGVYSVTVTDANDCTDVAFTEVEVNDNPANPSLSFDCSGGAGNGKITVNNPLGAEFQYSLNGGVFQSSPEFPNLDNGTYGVTVRNINSNCGSDVSFIDVNCACAEDPVVHLSSTEGSICGEDSITIFDNTFAGSATEVNLSHDGSGSLASDNENSSPFSFTYISDSNDIGEVVTIIVETDNPLGAPCSPGVSTFSLTINELPDPPEAGNGDQTICNGDSIPKLTVSVGQGITVDWYDSNTGGNLLKEGSLRFTPNNPGTFYAESRNSETGCISDSRIGVTLTINSLPDSPAVVSGDQTICEGENIPELSVNVDQGIKVDWYDAATGGNLILKDSIRFTPTDSGTYYAEAIDIMTGCVSDTRTGVTLTINNLPDSPVVVSGDQTICEGEDIPELSVNVDRGIKVDWYDAATGGNLILKDSIRFTPTEPRTYYAESIDTTTGCISSERIKVSLIIFGSSRSDRDTVICPNQFHPAFWNPEDEISPNENILIQDEGFILLENQVEVIEISFDENFTIDNDNELRCTFSKNITISPASTPDIGASNPTIWTSVFVQNETDTLVLYELQGVPDGEFNLQWGALLCEDECFMDVYFEGQSPFFIRDSREAGVVFCDIRTNESTDCPLRIYAQPLTAELLAELRSTSEEERVPEKPDLLLYPNPGSQQLNIALSSTPAAQMKLTVWDSRGKLVHSERVAVTAGSGDFLHTLSTEAWPPGLYLVRITGIDGELFMMDEKWIKF